MALTIAELKVLKHQPVFDFYAKCDVPFVNTRDLVEYHEKCVRWDADKQWPNIGNLLNMVNKSPEAIAFKKMYKKLLRSKEYYPTITIRERDPQVPGKSWYEYVPTPTFQEVFDFYAKCTVPFMTIDDLKAYHELCVLGAEGREEWPDVEALNSKMNDTAEAISFRKLYKKLSKSVERGNITINIQERNPKVPGEPLYEYISTPLTYQDVFDFYAKCEIPFKTYTDIAEYHNRCVRSADNRLPALHLINASSNTSPEALAFKELCKKLVRKRNWRDLTIKIQRCVPKVPGKALYEYVPAAPSIPIPAMAPVVSAPPSNTANPEIAPTRYVFSSRRPPVVSGIFVYYIQTEFYRVAMVGKHSGMLSQLVSEIGFTEAFDVIAYDCGKYDYSKVEKAVLSIMDARGFIVVRNQVVNDVGKFFDDTMRVLLG